MTTEEMVAFVLPVGTERVSFDWQDRKMIADRLQALLNKTKRQAARIEELELQRDAVITSCYFTRRGRVHWNQGQWFGTSIANELDPEAYIEAMRAIRENAGLPADGPRDSEPNPQPAPEPATVRVRGAVSVSSNGEWSIIGGSAFDPQMTALDILKDDEASGYRSGDAVYWITANLARPVEFIDGPEITATVESTERSTRT